MIVQEILIYTVLVIIILQILFTILIAPFFRKKRNEKIAKEQQTLINTIKIGHEVLLSSGIYGKINRIDEFTFMVEISSNNIIKVNKDAILGFFDAKVAKKINTQSNKKKKGK